MTATYTHGHHTSVLRSHRWRTAENSAAYLLDRLRPDHRLLDVGCGPGTITADLAARVGHVTAVDNAGPAVDEARRYCAELGLTNVDVQTADAYRLPFADNSFDVVHAHQVLQHLADPVAALAELRRVCRDGGVVAARDADYAAMAWYPQLPELDSWLELYRHIARGNGGEPDAGRRMLAWARTAGFASVTATGSVWCFATDDDRAWWSGMWAERITASGIAATAVAEGHATQNELERIADAWRRWGAEPNGWFSIVHGEILYTV